MGVRSCIAAAGLALALSLSGPGAAAQAPCPPAAEPPQRLSPAARTKLAQSFEKSRAHARHLWRDGAPVNADGTVNVYVEIERGSSNKWEYDMAQNRRVLDRTVPASLGGYPVGYGFVPGTIGADGDPFDGLVIGPAEAGEVVRGYLLGFMHMTDEKGSDGKVVIATGPRAAQGRALLNDGEKARIAAFFNRYKAEDDDPESFACVPGWADPAEARRHLDAAVRLFEDGRSAR
jgi:inorganic pyrophosphatase